MDGKMGGSNNKAKQVLVVTAPVLEWVGLNMNTYVSTLLTRL